MAARYIPSVMFASIAGLSLYSPVLATQTTVGLLLARNTQVFFKPETAARAFGIKVADARILTFVPGLAGRNLAAAASLTALLYLGESRAIGVVLASTIITGLTDAWISFKQDNEGAWIQHLVGTAGIALLSAPWLRNGGPRSLIR